MKKLAMISRGEFVVSDEFTYFLVNEDDFFKMTKQQQAKAFHKFCSVPLHQDEDSQSGNTDECLDVLNHLSVQPSQACITSIAFPILQEMFVEANGILSNESGIHQFGTDNTFYVENNACDGTAVHVKIRGRGNISCESSCLRWASYKLCCHTIAVAEKESMLSSVLRKYAKSNKGPNVTKLATQDMPKGRGKKATKATQRRKGRGRGGGPAKEMVCVVQASLI